MRTRDGDRIIGWAEKFIRLTKGSQTGQLVRLRDWQKDLIRELAGSGARRGYVQMPRKNSKTFLGAILALWNLAFDGEPGAEVYSVAGSRDQGRLLFQEAARMVQLDPHLSRHLTVYKYEIVHKASGSRYKVLAADAGHLEGLNPHMAIVDEVHVLGSDRRVWDVMNLGSGTREAPLILGITTPGVRWGQDGRDSLAWTLYDHGRRVNAGEVSDPTFYSRAWEAPADCDVWDRDAWTTANPALGDFLSIEDMEAAFKTTPENEARTKRLGQWVSAQAAWIPYGCWPACSIATETDGGIPVTFRPTSDTPVVLGFDGSFSRDSTALVLATIEAEPYLAVLGHWERGLTDAATWRVDRAEVKAAIRWACATYDVREVVADPNLWQSELQDLAAEGIPVVEYPQSPSRMVPAAQRFYEAVTTGVMRHDGNPAMTRHVGNTTVRPNGHIAKEHKDSGRRIDLTVAGVMAYERACALSAVKERSPVFVVWA